jgi:hypothetical protein
VALGVLEGVLLGGGEVVAGGAVGVVVGVGVGVDRDGAGGDVGFASTCAGAAIAGIRSAWADVAAKAVKTVAQQATATVVMAARRLFGMVISRRRSL